MHILHVLDTNQIVMNTIIIKEQLSQIGENIDPKKIFKSWFKTVAES